MAGWTKAEMPDQTGRVVIVTGANAGIGYESTLAFAQKGAQVVMACRSLAKAEPARQAIVQAVPGAHVDTMALDLGSLASVRAFAEAFNARYERLDVLMNNAGVMVPPYGKTTDGFELQFGTNHLGHFALTGLLLPKLLATSHSRVVTVSSGAANRGRIHFDDLQSERRYQPWEAYGQSKLANLLFMAELQRRLDADGDATISLAAQPGYVPGTELQRNGSAGMGLRFAILNRIMSHPAEDGARSPLYAATAPEARGGEYYDPRFVLVGPVTRRRLPAAARNTADAARLWDISERLTGVRFNFRTDALV